MTTQRYYLRFPHPFDQLDWISTGARKFLEHEPNCGFSVCLTGLKERYRVISLLYQNGYNDEEYTKLADTATHAKLIKPDDADSELGHSVHNELLNRGVKDRELTDELLMGLLKKYSLEPYPESLLPRLWDEVARQFACNTGLLLPHLIRNWAHQPDSRAAQGILCLAEEYWTSLPVSEVDDIFSALILIAGPKGIPFLERVIQSNERPDMDEPNAQGETLRYSAWSNRISWYQQHKLEDPKQLPRLPSYPPREVEDNDGDDEK